MAISPRILLSVPVAALVVCFSVSGEAPGHWAFTPPRRAPLPTVQASSWPRHAIDYWVLAQQESQGLAPASEATRSALLRRLSLDLTGLPPTLDELDAFLADDRPGAWERQVERLLASPHFGERMAQHWLDAARYADTHGYLIDPHREMWRWRDWVIAAFNANLPFDQFTIEQLAGDLLPVASLDQQIASGFNRNHMVNYENGAIPEEYRVEYVADRVATTATVWLGQTMDCARCHDHPYDPFTMRDYYRLFAFFNQVPEEGLDGQRGNAAPFIKAPTSEQQRRIDQLAAEIARLEKQQDDRRAASAAAVAAWETSREPAAGKVDATPPAMLHASFDELHEGSIPVQGSSESLAPARLSGDAVLVPGRTGQALLGTGVVFAATDNVPAPADAMAWTFSAWIFPTTADRMLITGVIPNGDTDATLHFVELIEGKLELRVQDRDARQVWRLRSDASLALRRWQHVGITREGSRSLAGVRLYIDGRPVTAQESGKRFDVAGLPAGKWYFGGAPDLPGFRGLLDDLHVYDRELSPTELALLGAREPVEHILAMPAARRTAEQQALVRDFYLARFDPKFRHWAAELESARRARINEMDSAPTSMVMRELAEPRPTHVLLRGVFDRQGEAVTAGTPDTLPKWSDHWPRNRLGLARWLVAPGHPLTARVTVNRLWQQFFGHGLVRTPEDFGQRGESPTHPELLDWLAVELVENGWDLKHLIRGIVLSATYCQSSVLSSDHAERDPENRWLTRGPHGRLDGEAIRDAALAISGLLDTRIGGASVFPYQPSGLWEEVSFNPAEFTAQTYVQSHGADLYRRSLYTFWKRTLPPANLSLFDAPTRETCTVSRSTTNTPLQALSLMNDPTFVEAARHLAERLLSEPHSTDTERVSEAFRRVTGRRPEAQEVATLVSLYERQVSSFRGRPRAAEELLSVGESPRNPELNSARLAAWTVVANVLLCLDETLTKN